MDQQSSLPLGAERHPESRAVECLSINAPQGRQTLQHSTVPRYEIIIVGDASDPSDAIRSLLHSTLGAVADIQIRMLEAISKRFGHSIEDLVETIRDSERKSDSVGNPVQEGIAAGLLVFEEKVGIKTKSGKKAVVKKTIKKVCDSSEV